MKFAFITPRYGADVSAGAEHGCRLLAEQVCARHDVDVLTTCATDPHTWKNELSEGADRVRGVVVRRFSVSQPFDRDGFRRFEERLVAGPGSRPESLEWTKRLGPWSPGLLDYLKRQHRSYDALVFFSVWHPTTVHGLQVAPERSVLFPYLHLKPALRFGLWAEVLSMPRALGFFSASERRLLRSYVRVVPQHEEVVGIGIDALPQQSYPRHQQDPADTLIREDEEQRPDDEEREEAEYLSGRGIPFRRRHRLYGRFAVYDGRVETDNGCEEMIDYFDSYTSRVEGDGSAALDDGSTESPQLALVLTGIKMMNVPDEPWIRLAGVLPDRERMIAYQGAELSIAPTPDDLLSQPLLESMAVGTPVLATARNESAVEHCRRANAGLYYSNRDEFVETMRMLTTKARLRQRLGENGRTYIRQNYRWDAVLGRFERLISRVRR